MRRVFPPLPLRSPRSVLQLPFARFTAGGVLLSAALALLCPSQVWAQRQFRSPNQTAQRPATTPNNTSQPAADPLGAKVDLAIEYTSRRVLSTEAHSPWQIAHGMLALRQNYVLKKNGEKVSALEWIASGPSYRNLPWFLKTEHGGKGHHYVEPKWFEGHPNQFVALFTFCDLPLDFEFQADKGTITLQDIINNAKMEVNDYEEVTWTLWFLCHYLEPDAEWQNQYKQPWSIERLIREQMSSKVTESACGGMHGLFAIAKARNAYLQSDKSLRGTWLEADMHLKRHISAVRSMQNRDGSFSSNYFKGPEWSRDLDKRVSTTGHSLEFLMMALSNEEIQQPWIRRAVERIADDLINSRRIPLEPGGMYHALDALILYRERTDPEFSIDKLKIPAPTVSETVASEAQSQISSPQLQSPRRIERNASSPQTPLK